MSEIDPVQLKTIYAELVGVASKLPNADSTPTLFNSNETLKYFNDLIDRATALTGIDQSRFKIIVIDNHYVSSHEFNSKVMGLLNIIKKVYLPGEPDPFSGPVPANISQTTVNQLTNQVQVQIATDISVKIGELLVGEVTPEEKTFLTKLKEVLPIANGVMDIISKLLLLAAAHKITIDRLIQMFGK
jgi:hypothetical protein